MHEPKPYRWGDPMPRNARAVKDRRIRLQGRITEAKLIRLGFDPVTFAFSGEDAEAGFAGLYELGLLSEPAGLGLSSATPRTTA